jgi:molybdopterin-containing oxidoreductase family membrane subunit
MWFERFVIIVTSLHRDFLPSSWGYYRPTIVDIMIYMGTFGLFFSAFLLFIRWIPMIAISEVKGTLPGADPHYGHHEASPDGASHEGAADAALAPAE